MPPTYSTTTSLTPSGKTVDDLTRHFASGDGFPDNPFAGDIMSQRHQIRMLTGMRERMRAEGFPVRDTDSHGYEQHAPHFALETGHQVSVGLSRKDAGWVMSAWHPDDGRAERTLVNVRLGTRSEDVPGLVRRELGCRHVVGEMMRQMGTPGGRGQRRNNVEVLHHDAEGAALPPEPEDETWMS